METLESHFHNWFGVLPSSYYRVVLLFIPLQEDGQKARGA